MPARNKINLLSKSNFESTFLGKLVDWAVNVGRWIVVVTEFVVICAFLSRFYFDTELANLFDNIKQNKTIVDSASEFEETFLLTQEKIRLAKILLAGINTPSYSMNEITKYLPVDMNLTSVNFNEKRVQLAGYCLSLESLNLFLWQLNNQPRFAQITLSSISQKEDEPTINFDINFILNDEAVKQNPKI